MAGFEAVPGGGAAAVLDEVEISILRSLAVQLLELVGPGDGPAQGGGSDPLDALDAMFTEGPTEPPSDPALARLFPDAYGGPGRKLSAEEEEEARSYSAEFRRYTESDLRTRKREDALAVVRSLDELSAGDGPGAVLRVDADGARRWLGTLNDLRLAIGARLEVTEDESGELYQLPDSDQRKPMVMAYLWLGGLQESLVETLLP